MGCVNYCCACARDALLTFQDPRRIANDGRVKRGGWKGRKMGKMNGKKLIETKNKRERKKSGKQEFIGCAKI